MKSRQITALMAAGLLCVTLAGCGGSSSGSSSDDAPKQSASEQKQQEQEEPEEVVEEEPEEEAAESNVAVTIDEVRLGQDYEGTPVAIVTYTFTNVSSDEAESFALSCYTEVYQNGVECEMAFVVDDLQGDSMTKVKQGASTTFQQAYELQDDSDIEIEVKEAFSWDDIVLASGTYTFK